MQHKVGMGIFWCSVLSLAWNVLCLFLEQNDWAAFNMAFCVVFGAAAFYSATHHKWIQILLPAVAGLLSHFASPTFSVIILAMGYLLACAYYDIKDFFIWPVFLVNAVALLLIKPDFAETGSLIVALGIFLYLIRAVIKEIKYKSALKEYQSNTEVIDLLQNMKEVLERMRDGQR